MDRSQLAINSVSTSQDSLDEMLAAYDDAGFQNVEFQLGAVNEFLEEGHEVADVRALLDEHGLDCAGGFETTATCFGDDVVADNERIVRNAGLLADLGADRMVVGTDGPDDPAGVEVIDEYAAAFATLADEIADTGVVLCIEFNWSPTIRSLRSAAEVARRAGDGVGVLFDPAHYHCTPTKRRELTDGNVAQIAHVHVDDMVDKPGDLSHCNEDRALPGEGHLDLPGLFGRIEEAGYDGYFSIEMFDDDLWAMDAADAAGEMYDSLAALCDRT